MSATSKTPPKNSSAGAIALRPSPPLLPPGGVNTGGCVCRLDARSVTTAIDRRSPIGGDYPPVSAEFRRIRGRRIRRPRALEPALLVGAAARPGRIQARDDRRDPIREAFRAREQHEHLAWFERRRNQQHRALL